MKGQLCLHKKNQIISSLGTKEAQYEDLVKKLEAKNIEISQISGKEQSLTEKNENLSNELKKVQDQLEKLNNLNITTKSNYENKISSQNENCEGFSFRKRHSEAKNSTASRNQRK